MSGPDNKRILKVPEQCQNRKGCEITGCRIVRARDIPDFYVGIPEFPLHKDFVDITVHIRVYPEFNISIDSRRKAKGDRDIDIFREFFNAFI